FIIFLTIALPSISAADCQPDEPPCLETLSQPQYGLSEAEIALYPEPNVQPLTINNNLLYDRAYQQIISSDALTIYDAPNGNVTGTLDAGFDFLTTLRSQDGWTEINTDQWVRSEHLGPMGASVSHFTGVLLPETPLPYPMAWLMVNLYPSTAPGADPDSSLGLLPRYTRVNIYSSTEVDGYNWYQIGVDRWVHQFHVAKIEPIQRPETVDTNHWISIDLYEQIAIAYEGETPIFATLVSSGLERWPTQEGLFHVYFRLTRKNMSGGTPGDDFYFLEEVPWTMFFDEGRALHGAYWHDGFGYRRSHGCVNLSITDAHWLYQWVAEEMDSLSSAEQETGPAVYVYSSGQYN
ncbi:MAG: L,D-transpeptidase, partial [Anaerolineae bacterium]|nr:L,D-transpeptidase [Anaerolineae bacterium]